MSYRQKKYDAMCFPTAITLKEHHVFCLYESHIFLSKIITAEKSSGCGSLLTYLRRLLQGLKRLDGKVIC